MRTYQNGYIGPTGHAFVIAVDDVKRQIRQRLAVDFGRRSPGSSTIVAEMSWADANRVQFEGLTGITTVELSSNESAEAFELRVLDAWLSFTGEQRRVDELDTAARAY